MFCLMSSHHLHLRQQKVNLECQIIANEMVLTDLYEQKSRALESRQLDSFSALLLAISAQIRSEHLLQVALMAEYDQVLTQIGD